MIDTNDKKGKIERTQIANIKNETEDIATERKIKK